MTGVEGAESGSLSVALFAPFEGELASMKKLGLETNVGVLVLAGGSGGVHGCEVAVEVEGVDPRDMGR